MPETSQGRWSKQQRQQAKQFAQDLRAVDNKLDFKMSARGWAYFLENEGVIDKSQLDYAQNKINQCRDKGILPLDFTAADDSRSFMHVEKVHYSDPEDYLSRYLNTILRQYNYDISFWDGQDYYIQVLVEKVDLRELFEPICKKYNIPIATSKGWSSKLQRGRMIARWYAWEQRGLKPVLLYCGDHDPAGFRISDNLKKNLSEPGWKVPVEADWIDSEYITGWTPSDLEIDRFGLNDDHIDEADLTKIDNLLTGTGRDLADPSHNDYHKPYVQDYIQEYGEWKVEANALVTNPTYGRDVFREVLSFYLGEDPKSDYKAELNEQKRVIEDVLHEHDLYDPMRRALSSMR
jgi:hypothetical protein